MSRRSSAAPSPAASDSTGANGNDKGQNKQKMLLSADTGHFSLVRALHLADLITELNGFCGGKLYLKMLIVILTAGLLTLNSMMSIFSSMRYCLGESTQYRDMWFALGFMPFGLFFDFMDGKIARWRRKSSLMGQELDSLADLISFGVAPASAAFALGMRTTLDHVFLTFFVLCGLTRLARFNVTVATLPKDKSGKSQFFEGTPIPTTLSIAGIMGFWVWNGWVQEEIPFGVANAGTALEFHPAVGLFLLSGCLMVSRTLHIPKP